MMGFVPFSTPQTFSRIVVLPAFALPMTRMRKWGHLYRSLSIERDAASEATYELFLMNVCLEHRTDTHTHYRISMFMLVLSIVDGVCR